MSSIAITPSIDPQAPVARTADHPVFEHQLSKRLREVKPAGSSIAGKAIFKATSWIDRVRGLPKRAAALPAAPPPSRAASLANTAPTELVFVTSAYEPGVPAASKKCITRQRRVTRVQSSAGPRVVPLVRYRWQRGLGADVRPGVPPPAGAHGRGDERAGAGVDARGVPLVGGAEADVPLGLLRKEVQQDVQHRDVPSSDFPAEEEQEEERGPNTSDVEDLLEQMGDEPDPLVLLDMLRAEMAVDEAASATAAFEESEDEDSDSEETVRPVPALVTDDLSPVLGSNSMPVTRTLYCAPTAPLPALPPISVKFTAAPMMPAFPTTESDEEFKTADEGFTGDFDSEFDMAAELEIIARFVAEMRINAEDDDEWAWDL